MTATIPTPEADEALARQGSPYILEAGAHLWGHIDRAVRAQIGQRPDSEILAWARARCAPPEVVTITLPSALSEVARQRAALVQAQEDAHLPWEEGERPADLDPQTAIRAVDEFTTQHRAELALIDGLTAALPEGGELRASDHTVLAFGRSAGVADPTAGASRAVRIPADLLSEET